MIINNKSKEVDLSSNLNNLNIRINELQTELFNKIDKELQIRAEE